uniref:Uncharacterized protein n=1 Tax=Nelumbo nucifera TaxID=4432 RepID=A0A822Z5M4_NELNU|nr:TPA_asm: hypothetical protein HUJ06_007469 [Nelumbo nucifera]
MQVLACIGQVMACAYAKVPLAQASGLMLVYFKIDSSFSFINL